MTKVCPRCHQPNLPEAAFCASCAAPLAAGPAVGAPPQQGWPPQGNQAFGQAPTAKAGAGGKAITALILAIAALVLCCGPLTGIPAAIVGWMEQSAINAGQSSPAGKWMAQVGIWGGIAISVVWVIFFFIWVLFSMMAGAGAYY